MISRNKGSIICTFFSDREQRNLTIDFDILINFFKIYFDVISIIT